MPENMEKVAKENLPVLAKKLLEQALAKRGLGRATLITLMGDLGAGKTTLVQALARELGVEVAIQSPTYVLMKKYELVGQPFTTLIHIDAYRLADAEEFAALKPSSFLLDEDVLVCIEWPERIQGALPQADVALNLSSENASDNERYIGGI
jgi:tRNA threonylcarbamoyladenosine biosynthesis protein TsaE